MQAWTGAGALPARAAASSESRAARASFLSFMKVPFQAMKGFRPHKRSVPAAAKRDGHFHSPPLVV
jgi:hypothetical protein